MRDLELEVPDYKLYRIDRQNKKGGGVCVYVSRNYKSEFLRDISLISPSGFHQLWLKIKVRNSKSIAVCMTYRPPDTPLSCFDSDLAASFIYVSSLNLPVYILGDLNCNLLDSDGLASKALTNFYRSFNLSQLITTPTRVTESTTSLLDVVLASDTKQVREANVLQSSISDHDLVYVTLRLKKPRTKPVFITSRSFKHYKPERFYEDISVAPWSVVDVFSDVEDKLYAFNSLFNTILHQDAPIKTFKARGKPNLCVTDNIRQLMKTRDCWRRKAKKTNDPLAWNAYKNFRREVKNEIKLAEREFVADQIQSNPNNSNSIWKAIRLCIPKKSSTQRTFSRDDKIVADEFNQFFVSVGPTGWLYLTDRVMRTTDSVIRTTDREMHTTDRVIHTTDRVIRITDRVIRTTDRVIRKTNRAIRTSDREMHTTEGVIHTTDREIHTTDREIYTTDRRSFIV